MAKLRFYEIGGGGKSQKTNQENNQCHKKGMDIHPLPVDEANCFQLLFPIEVARENDVNQRQQNTEPPTMLS